ncbi:MAG: phosphatase PAP2 family protein [Clostridia bacterium]|nr:phosphatase PAP2 family protein [Clostridia bacterium]
MTRESYIRITDAARRTLRRLPGGEALLRLPTYLCAAVYMLTLLHLMLTRDVRLFRALLVPAACFIVCTLLRPVIRRQRPYDRFGAPPVGSYTPGKGKSMPSRHTASAAAIAFAIIYVFPCVPSAAVMLALAALIAFLRVASGQHYPTDVLAALLLSGVISLAGYLL